MIKGRFLERHNSSTYWFDAPNNRTWKDMKQNLTTLKEKKKDKSLNLTWDFNFPP